MGRFREVPAGLRKVLGELQGGFWEGSWQGWRQVLSFRALFLLACYSRCGGYHDFV